MDELVDIVRQAYISGAEANAEGDSETFAEHYGCLPEPEYTEEEVVSTTPDSPNDYEKEYLATARRLIEIGRRAGGTPRTVANDIILLAAPPYCNFESFKTRKKNGNNNH